MRFEAYLCQSYEMQDFNNLDTHPNHGSCRKISERVFEIIFWKKKKKPENTSPIKESDLGNVILLQSF